MSHRCVMRCLGVAVEEQNGQRTGNAPEPPDWMASGREVKCAAGIDGDGDRIGGSGLVVPAESKNLI